MLLVGARGIAGNEGGVEKFAEEFVRRVAHSSRITVLCLSDRKPQDIGDIELVLTPKSKLMRTDKALYYMVAAWICLTRKFDHILLLGLNSAMLVLPLRLLFWRRANIVVRSGSVDYLLDKWGFLSKFYFRTAEGLLRFADLVVSVAPSIQRHLAERGIRSIVIRNGVSLSPNPRPITAREQRHLVAVGRVTSQKNYAMLIEAAKHLRDRGVEVSIIGGADLSDESNRLRSLVNSKKVSNVTFTGVMDRDQVLERLSMAALFVNCSVNEGMSNSVLEAIQQGTPILLSNISGNRDLGLPDSFYFDPGSPTELSERIVQALETPSDFLADRKRFEDWDEVINKYRRCMSLPS